MTVRTSDGIDGATMRGGGPTAGSERDRDEKDTATRGSARHTGPRPHEARSLRVSVALVAAVALTLGAGLATADRGAAQAPAAKGAWKLVFNDEFNGKAVKPKYWNVRHRDYLPYDEAVITGRRANVWTAQGLLVMQARREQAQTGSSGPRQYTTAYLDTIGKRSWHYGRFEMRAKLPSTVGTWPAFWLRANRGGGEIDILEGVGGRPELAHQAIFKSTNDASKNKTQNDFFFPRGTTTAQWHTYGVIVAPELVTWTIDGKPVFRAYAKDFPWLKDALNEPFNIRLNLQVGGSFPRYYGRSLSDQSLFPARYIVDWVRVYQRQL